MSSKTDQADENNRADAEAGQVKQADNQDLQISTLEDVKALIARKHGRAGAGSDDPIWMLYTMFEVFTSDLSVIINETRHQQSAEREKLKAMVPQVAQVLADNLNSELQGLAKTLNTLRQDAEASSIENLLKQQAQFSGELGGLSSRLASDISAVTSRLKRQKWPLAFLTLLNWLAVGAFYLIMIK